MAFLLGLISFYLLAWLAYTLTHATLLAGAMQGVIATTIMFTMIGIAHFAKPEKLEAMIPERWPYKRAANYISGAAEILLGIGLLFEATRTYAAWGLILLLIAIFPANIYEAVHKRSIYTISRLFFQPAYIAWLWWFCLSGCSRQCFFS